MKIPKTSKKRTDKQSDVAIINCKQKSKPIFIDTSIEILYKLIAGIKSTLKILDHKKNKTPTSKTQNKARKKLDTVI